MAVSITVQELPLIAVSNQRISVTLSGQNCSISVYQRAERLYLDLSIGLDTVRTGCLCIPYAPIITGNTVFSGQLYIVDVLSPYAAQTTPHFSGLGDRFKLYYLPPEAVETVENAKYEFYSA